MTDLLDGVGLNLRLKRLNRRGDLRLQNLKRFYNRTSVVESYVHGVASLHVQVGPTGNYVWEYFSSHADEAARQASGANELETLVTPENSQMHVLVRVRDCAKGFRPINSFARLQRSDSLYVVIRQTLEVGLCPLRELDRVVLNEELSPVLYGTGIGPRQLKDEIIKGGPQVVNAVTNDERKPVSVDVELGLVDPQLIADCIVLNADTVEFYQSGCLNFSNGFPKVFVGAFDPFASAI